MNIDCSLRDWLRDYLGAKDDGDGVVVNANANGRNYKFIFPGSGAEFVRHMKKKGVTVHVSGNMDSRSPEFFILIEMTDY